MLRIGMTSSHLLGSRHPDPDSYREKDLQRYNYTVELQEKHITLLVKITLFLNLGRPPESRYLSGRGRLSPELSGSG
ncbi:hypothetical protein [Aquiflexum balticum]|uniref:hypothetical protein n=1 Tax=Aquiflexum balticum TaxID=280473 RepID=UPI0009FC8769|nr:hypothetical protein [Aquiflexum balticum]